jgi:hypothetical protein
MAREPRVADLRHPLLRLEEAGDLEGVSRVLLEPQRQGDDPAHDQPGVEGADAGAEMDDAGFAHLGDELSASHHRAPERAVAVQVLGGRITTSAPSSSGLWPSSPDRCCDDRGGADLVGDLRDLSDVADRDQ